MIAGQFNTADNAELEKELAEMMGESYQEPPIGVTGATKSSAKINNAASNVQNLPVAPTGPVLPAVPNSHITTKNQSLAQVAKSPVLV